MTHLTLRPNISILIALFCCALLAIGGCRRQGPGLSDLQATSGDRHIRVLVEGNAFVSPSEDKFTVKLPGHELVIGKEQVLLDQQARAKIPTGARRFEVTAKGGTLTVNANGAEILKMPLKQ